MKRLCAVVALAALFQYHSAHAECRKIEPADEPVWVESMEVTPTPGQIYYDAQQLITFANNVLDVDATLGVGETIATGASVSPGNAFIVRCFDLAGTLQFKLNPSLDLAMPPGVGYKVFYVRADGSSTELPYTHPWTKPANEEGSFPYVAAGNHFEIQLIKTGAMQSVSTVNLSNVAYIAGGGDGLPALTVLANPVTLRVLPHCQVTSDKPLLVDFGQFGPREVSTTGGPTQPVAITVACDGPTPPNTVSATLAAQPDPDDSDFIKNGGTATGLAIRLRDATTQALLKPQNVTSVLTKSSPGYGTTFDLEASVLRVGAAAPVPGTIDAQAVVTLTFL